jgi:hypothetical protein
VVHVTKHAHNGTGPLRRRPCPEHLIVVRLRYPAACSATSYSLVSRYLRADATSERFMFPSDARPGLAG